MTINLTLRGDLDRPLTSLEADANVTSLRDAILAGSGIPEAPLDGAQYARQGGTWSVVVTEGSGSGGIPHAPSDGRTYASKDGVWIAFAAGIPDAPNDASTYVRKGGGWVPSTSGIVDAPNDAVGYLRKGGEWVAATPGGSVAGGMRHKGFWQQGMTVEIYDVVEHENTTWMSRGNYGTTTQAPSYDNDGQWHPLGFPGAYTLLPTSGRIWHEFATPHRTSKLHLREILDEFEKRLRALEK